MKAAKIEAGEAFKKLESIVGTSQALKIMDQFAGQFVYFPQRKLLNEKHQKIINEFQKGASVMLLAEKYGYTATRIRQIVKKMKQEPEKIKFSWKNIVGIFKK
jgi:Mor family transcriptional regulator